MKTVLSTLLVLCLFASTLGISAASASEMNYSGYPTISIVSVVADQSVTIKANNLPASDTFSVLMNYMGTKGKNGIVVGTINTGSGGTQTYTYNIPDALKGQKQIAIRIQSTTGSGYFAYNWFTNKTGGIVGQSARARPAPLEERPPFHNPVRQRHERRPATQMT